MPIARLICATSGFARLAVPDSTYPEIISTDEMPAVMSGIAGRSAHRHSTTGRT